jgi:hypothetical protein
MAPTQGENEAAAKRTREEHNARTEAAGARLARLAAAAKPIGRQKTGMNGDDKKRLLRLVAARLPWENLELAWADVKRGMPDIADGVLEAWRDWAFEQARGAK